MPEYREDLARSLNRLGILMLDQRKWAESEAAYRQALTINAKLAVDFPAIPSYRREMAGNHNNLGVVLEKQGKPAEAEAACRQSLAINEKLANDFPTMPEYSDELATSLNNMADLLDDQGKHVEAEAAHRRALGIHEKLAADFPALSMYAVELGGNCCDYGTHIRQAGRPEASLEWYQKAIARLERVLVKEPRLVAARKFLCISNEGRATALEMLGRHVEATAAWERALEMDDGTNKQEIRSNLVMARFHGSRKAKDAAGCLARRRI